MSSVTTWTIGVAAGPALLLDLGVEDLDVDGADGPGLRQLLVVRCGAEQVLGRPRQQVLGGHVAVVALEEGLEPSLPACSASSAAECNNC